MSGESLEVKNVGDKLLSLRLYLFMRTNTCSIIFDNLCLILFQLKCKKMLQDNNDYYPMNLSQI